MFNANSKDTRTASTDIFLVSSLLILNIYLFQVNSKNSRTVCEICTVLTVKTPERHQLTSSRFLHCWFWTYFIHCSSVSIIDFWTYFTNCSTVSIVGFGHATETWCRCLRSKLKTRLLNIVAGHDFLSSI